MVESPRPLAGFGKELVLDLHECDPSTFTRKSIGKYLKEVCDLIDMERCEMYWWDDVGVPVEEQQTEPHLKGTSVVQFILTSNITVHTLDLLGNVYLNIFSCKDFDASAASHFSEKWFGGKIVNEQIIERL